MKSFTRDGVRFTPLYHQSDKSWRWEARHEEGKKVGRATVRTVTDSTSEDKVVEVFKLAGDL